MPKLDPERAQRLIAFRAITTENIEERALLLDVQLAEDQIAAGMGVSHSAAAKKLRAHLSRGRSQGRRSP